MAVLSRAGISRVGSMAVDMDALVSGPMAVGEPGSGETGRGCRRITGDVKPSDPALETGVDTQGH